MSAWVYIQSEKGNSSDGTVDLYTVGFYRPNGSWEPESDHDNTEAAASRVHYLNGACAGLDPAAIPALIEAAANAEHIVIDWMRIKSEQYGGEGWIKPDNALTQLRAALAAIKGGAR